MKKILFVSCLILFLTACTGTRLLPVRPEITEVFDTFEAGQVITANVGDAIVHARLNRWTYPGFEAIQDFSLPKDTNISPFAEMPTIKKGSKWIAKSTTEDGNFVCNLEPVPLQVRGAGVSWSWNVALLVKKTGEAYGTTRCNGFMYSCEQAAHTNLWERSENLFKPTDITKDSAMFGMEIIYTGKSKNGISFTYRASGLKDLEFNYDIETSKVIGIKGIEFEIIEATNSYIKFTNKTSREKLRELLKKTLRNPQGVI